VLGLLARIDVANLPDAVVKTTTPARHRPIATPPGRATLKLVPSVPPYRAQLATLAERAPSGERWLHELKYDGYRIGCVIEHGQVRLLTPRDGDWTEKFPEIVAAVGELRVETALLDGEVTIVEPKGTTSLRALESACCGGPREGLTYFVFDLIDLDGESLAALPLEQRKAKCEVLLQRAG